MMQDARSAKRPRAPIERRPGLAQASVLMLATFLPVMAIVSLAPDIPRLFGQFHAVPQANVLIPLLITAPGLFIALLSPVAGALVDFVGRRRILLLALVLYAGAGLAPLVLDDLHQILASRLVLGLAEAILMTAGNTLIGDYFEGESRRKWLAFQSAVGSVLGTLMWLSGGLLADRGWRWPFAIYAAAVPVFLIALVSIYEPQRKVVAAVQAAAGVRPRFPYASMTWLCAVTVFTTTVYYVYTLNAGLVFDHLGARSPAVIGVVTALASIGVPIGAYVYSRISGAPIPFLLALMYVTFGVGMVGLGLASDYKVGGAIAFAQQFGAGMTIPVLVAWAQSRLPFEHRGRGMGVWVTCFFLGQFTCPFVISQISALASGIQGTFIVFGIVSLAAAAASALAGLLERRGRKPARAAA